MKDRLEEFVRNNSAEFDLHEPSPELWGQIEKSMQPKKEIRWMYYLSRAAVVVFLIGATLLGQRMLMKRTVRSNDKNMADVEINIPELQEAEMYYTGMINAKLEEVRPYLSEYPSLEDELQSDLSELDSVYLSLKRDLRDNIANHEVIEAMIQNYRLRIAILEDLMEFLESQTEEENINNIEQI